MFIDISKMKKYRVVCRLESGWGEGVGWNKDISISLYIYCFFLLYLEWIDF